MAVELVTSNIWRLITKTVKSHASKSMVAVAYFGQNAASMLPLKKGSTLLVDASEKAIKSGQTCPAELLKLYYKGVKVYSLENLHAKIYVVGNTLLIGSANVSGNSSIRLQEAIIKTNDRQAVNDAKAFIESFCSRQLEMGDEELMRLNKLYRSPKGFGVGMAKNMKDKKHQGNNSELVVAKTTYHNWTYEEEKEIDKGYKEAKAKRSNKSRHECAMFIWDDVLPAKIGDTIVEIYWDGTYHYVYPPATFIHSRKWSNGKKTQYFCYVERPKDNPKNIEVFEEKLSKENFMRLKRNGRKSRAFKEEFIHFWK